ncbi:terpene synthase family protein [Talaromyces stipitatus ATCC 10500]|uniref:Terpene synthase family protein n=1 Tax=Talaromyces stipitatus (strain ATCC 10500 / CBS 375.48 / QM 6759 / NRRL 1006) TaxID=441959 RepID=B8MSU1_TALSN|nr:terpene synthase family protein [Talaromyces stipitatus ATCC 10500]EED11984.1 terpene synthase family protein [Talaromyces stipitatus ATCC 10500]
MEPYSNQSLLQSRVSSLLQKCVDGCSNFRRWGSLSCSVYDTAWVSMIFRDVVNGQPKWLFPASFGYLLLNQSTGGGWCSETTSEIDAILNTSAALLALKTHQQYEDGGEGEIMVGDLHQRIQNATAFLQAKLETWDVEATDHVGSEILVSAHLRLLSEKGITFDFPGSESLKRLNKEKLKKFSPELLYGSEPITLIHSLEAFAGQIDFDKLSHRLNFGSMLASPSSTSAYLIYANSWNDSAEAYICSVVEHTQGGDSGAVPSVFPSTIFEITWVISTLLENGPPLDKIHMEQFGIITGFLKDQLHTHGEVIGFASGVIADADDTARIILTLNLAGINISPNQLIKTFKHIDHFQTYVGERNPSISTNCNVLDALLHTADPDVHIVEIALIIRFLYKLYSKGELNDKWNTSAMYVRMLLANPLSKLWRLRAMGSLPSLPEDCQQIAPLVLNDILFKTIHEQGHDGSWHNKCPEVTAYTLLALASISNTPLGLIPKEELQSSITKGRMYLEANKSLWDQGEAIWKEKVSYKSSLLSEAYCTAAVRALTFTWDTAGKEDCLDAINISSTRVKKFSKFYSCLPLFSEEPLWRLNTALFESYLWLPQLIASKLNIFPNVENPENDKYLEYIPQTWAICNAKNGNSLEPGFMWEMMMVSMLNFQVDRFIEAVIGQEHMINHVNAVKSIVHCLFDEEGVAEHDTDGQTVFQKSSFSTCERHNGTKLPTEKRATQDCAISTETQYDCDQIKLVFRRFITYILTRPAVLCSPKSLKCSLRRELKAFLLAQLTQAEESRMFCLQTDRTKAHPVCFSDAPTSYFQWVHSTASENTSCPYSYHFFNCLISYYKGYGKRGCHPDKVSGMKAAGAVLYGVRQRYLSEALCQHLATMCRQYNDYGSVLRDQVEGNLSSVNFSEFWEGLPDHKDGCESNEMTIKANLMWVAEYERKGCMRALERLDELGLDEQTKRMIKTFVDVTDLYGQIYVARDIGTRIKTD